ncbi:hypothetical protein L6452_34309 [Arctium lappa]|uniref:Uncharacterized protein n=1 Tax=Arctium lappa TaxID=4217 RepID=A0ACB8YJ04_ARCLA|nr:hypothetical protein L6452_34309 [Arctium lappa]
MLEKTSSESGGVICFSQISNSALAGDDNNQTPEDSDVASGASAKGFGPSALEGRSAYVSSMQESQTLSTVSCVDMNQSFKREALLITFFTEIDVPSLSTENYSSISRAHDNELQKVVL